MEGMHKDGYKDDSLVCVCVCLIERPTNTENEMEGNIRNTEKLSYDRQQQYEIQVTAWDCGQKRALHSVPVRIDVKPVCKPGWQAIYHPTGRNVSGMVMNSGK
ncbi:hypothetical protein PAMP_018966 [Pampus punctatissimus]